MSTATETLTWHELPAMPDADINVLATLITDDGPEVAPAHWDGTDWIDNASGAPIGWEVVSWCDWPAGHVRPCDSA